MQRQPTPRSRAVSLPTLYLTVCRAHCGLRNSRRIGQAQRAVKKKKHPAKLGQHRPPKSLEYVTHDHTNLNRKAAKYKIRLGNLTTARVSESQPADMGRFALYKTPHVQQSIDSDKPCVQAGCFSSTSCWVFPFSLSKNIGTGGRRRLGRLGVCVQSTTHTFTNHNYEKRSRGTGESAAWGGGDTTKQL